MAAVREILGGGRGGELGERIRSKDWSQTPLGDSADWPASLRTAVDICVNSRVPLMVVWGPERTAIFNDAFAPLLGARRECGPGATAREVLSDVWESAGPVLEGVLADGEASWSHDLPLPVRRNDFVEEAYFTLSCTPIHDEDNEVGGALIGVFEMTERILGERRFALLEELGARTIAAASEEEACVRAARSLARDTADVPFALFYLADEGGYHARLVAAAGLATGSPAVVPAVELCVGGETGGWPLPLTSRAAVPIDDLYLRFGAIITDPWPEPVRRAVILPLRRVSEAAPFGYAVFGLSPRLPFDARYAGFLDLIAEHTTAAIENARAYHAQRDRAETLSEFERDRRAFLSNVSHEFRTPLTLIVGPLTEALDAPERALEGNELEVVHRNALRLLKLANTLLDFSRIESGEIQANPRPTYLSMLTTDLASTFRTAFERAGLDFDVSCQPLGRPVQIDRDMWEKIVLNLLSNALKFTFEGRVSVRLRTAGEEILLEVEDTGVGIMPDELPYVFDRFYRGANTKARSDEGTGIGLALVRELTEIHGGTVDVHSVVGRGTRFRVSFPLLSMLTPETDRADPIPETDIHASAYLVEALRWLPEPVEDGARSVGATRVGQAEPAETAETGTRPGGRVLVAEHNADMRAYLARLLRGRWNVEVVTDGPAALAAARRDAPTLVVTDIAIPGLDGIGLLRTLRADPSTADVPVLILSARAGEETVSETLRAGADDCLVKPFAPRALLARVDKLIGETRARVAAREAVAAERRRLEMMFNDSPAAVFVVRGPEPILEFANRKALETWSRSPEIIGTPFEEAIPELGDAESIGRLRQVFLTGRPVHARGTLSRLDPRRDGILTDAFFDYAWIPLRDAEGTVSAVFIHAFEVTELVAERRAAEAANRMKDEFLATVSHELRAPLNAILGWTSLLRTSPGRDLHDRALATIERSVRTQVRLIEDILDVERIVSGKLRLEVGSVSVQALIDTAADLVRPAAEEKQVRLDINVHPGTGSVRGDVDRLQQVVCNLLINSIKFTHEGGKVTLHARRSADLVTLRVRDNGVGIPRQQLPHVFERFRQADDASSDRESGLGLGLEIVRSLVELHGGTVNAQSFEGVGTTFTITLPGDVTRPALAETVKSER